MATHAGRVESQSVCIFRGAQCQALHLKSLLDDRGVPAVIHPADPYVTGFYSFDVYVRNEWVDRIRVAAVLEQFEEKLSRSRPYMHRSPIARQKRSFWGISLLVLNPISFFLAAIPFVPFVAMACYTVAAMPYLRSARREEGRIPGLALVSFILAELLLLSEGILSVIALPR